jgi:hypothetical protein
VALIWHQETPLDTDNHLAGLEIIYTHLTITAVGVGAIDTITFPSLRSVLASIKVEAISPRATIKSVTFPALSHTGGDFTVGGAQHWGRIGKVTATLPHPPLQTQGDELNLAMAKDQEEQNQEGMVEGVSQDAGADEAAAAVGRLLLDDQSNPVTGLRVGGRLIVSGGTKSTIGTVSICVSGSFMSCFLCCHSL